MSDVSCHQPQSPIDVDQDFPSDHEDQDQDQDQDRLSDCEELLSQEGGEELINQWIQTEAEKDAAARKRQRPVAAKEPSPLESLLAERPNLAEYFESFAAPIPDVDRIKICRAYASYLATMQPKRVVKRGDQGPYKKRK